MATTESSAVVVPWSVVSTTLIVSFLLGLIFYLFWIVTRESHRRSENKSIYELRHFQHGHRSPAAFKGGSFWGWAEKAYNINDDEALRCMGLDSFMFCRLLRLGFRISVFGTLCSVVLIPIYATGGATGADTEQFNSVTLASVKQGSARLWATALLFCAFCGVCMYLLFTEWKEYAKRRYEFMAKGDADTDKEYKYAVLVENVPLECRSNQKLREYLERLFPNQIRQVCVLQKTNQLNKLIQERQQNIETLEKAVAFTRAKPFKPAPQMKAGVAGIFSTCKRSEKVDTIPYCQSEIERLNSEIDKERARLHDISDKLHEQELSSSNRSFNPLQSFKGAIKEDGQPASTAFVTFTSLRAKQPAIQCELSGKVDNMDCQSAPIPNTIIWENILVPQASQMYYTVIAACLLSVGVLFWAIPVTFVTGLANLNSLLDSFGLPTLNESTFYYGIISGILPVVFLQLLMIVVYNAIEAFGKSFIRKKSMSEVDAYTFFWHQLYQFANLWLILIGGSIFNQLSELIENPGSVIKLIASALPGASFFFLNMIIMGSFFGVSMELSQFVPWIVNVIKGKLLPEPMQTQRMLDTNTKPPTIAWGQTLPSIVFIFLVTLIYMPIVPLMEVFALVYFGAWYLVYRHNCLHLYVQVNEGGGLIFETFSTFFMACLYTAELVVFAYLGIKEAPGPATFTLVVVLPVTLIAHNHLRRTVAGPLANLSLELATKIDEEDGELPRSDADTASSATAVEHLLYAQPCLKLSADERGPKPYRSNENDEEAGPDQQPVTHAAGTLDYGTNDGLNALAVNDDALAPSSTFVL